MDAAPCDPVTFRPTGPRALTDEDLIQLQLAIRVPESLTADDFQWRVDDVFQYSHDEAALLAGKPIPELRALYVSIPRGLHPTSLTVRFDAPTGAWQSLGAWNGRNGGVISTLGDRSLVFSDAVESGGGTVISFAHAMPASVPIRIMAFDETGREFEGRRAGGGWAPGFGLLAGRFDIPLDRVAGFRVQSRLVENLVIPGIALKPRPADDPR